MQPETKQEPGPPDDGRPKLTKQQAEWAVHVAAIKARQEAAARGADPGAAAALLAAGTGERLAVAGLVLVPPSAGHLLLLDQVETLYAAENKRPNSLVLSLCLATPADVWELVNRPGADAADRVYAIDSLGFALSLRLEPGDIERIRDWLGRHFQMISGDPDTADAAEGNGPGSLVAAPTLTGSSPPLPEATAREAAAGC